MSRRAASIEPEDGECTPSPSAMQQAEITAKHSHQLSAPVVQALPPPPSTSLRSAGHGHITVGQRQCRQQHVLLLMLMPLFKHIPVALLFALTCDDQALKQNMHL